MCYFTSGPLSSNGLRADSAIQGFRQHVTISFPFGPHKEHPKTGISRFTPTISMVEMGLTAMCAYCRRSDVPAAVKVKSRDFWFIICVARRKPDVSDEPVAFTFKVEKQAKQKPR
jgi:hypothetical protein